MSLVQSMRRAVPVAAIGAVASTLCDMNHAFTGALAYPDPWVTGGPWWSLPAFFVAFMWMAFLYAIGAPALGRFVTTARSREPGTCTAFVETLVAFVLAYLISGFAHETPTVLALVLYGTFAVRLAATYDRAFALIAAIVLAIGGMLGEGGLTMAGLVTYADADIVGVPWWLGGVYMHGALCLREGMRWRRAVSPSSAARRG